jgi:exoribonuclease R
MLLANRAVAELVSAVKVNKKEIPFPYRVHDRPDEEKLIPFMNLRNASVTSLIQEHRKALQNLSTKC